MRLYKIIAVMPDEIDASENRTHWVGSLTDATARRKGLALEGFARKEIETVEVDVPTDKTGLLAFLNGLSA